MILRMTTACVDSRTQMESPRPWLLSDWHMKPCVMLLTSSVWMQTRSISKQLDLLSVLLHLKLLSELVTDEEIRALNFETAQDLYRRFWEYKQRVIRERLGRTVQWTRVVYALCDYMHEQQTLSTPEVAVEEWISDTDAMVSENVLVLENKRYSFFHEGFFDYAFARRFAGGSQSLLGLLLSDEQRLFRRAQVRQILLYLRDTEF